MAGGGDLGVHWPLVEAAIKMAGELVPGWESGYDGNAVTTGRLHKAGIGGSLPYRLGDRGLVFLHGLAGIGAIAGVGALAGA
jgi:hypothetical protein